MKRLKYSIIFVNLSKNIRYASLYFCCAVDQSDNELVVLEVIHRYVELLDKYFGSVSKKRVIDISFKDTSLNLRFL